MRVLWVFILTAGLSFAFTWPWEVPKKATQPKTPQQQEQPEKKESKPWWATPQKEKEGKSTSEGGAASATLQKVNIPKIPKVHKIYKPPYRIVKGSSIAAQPPMDMSIIKIQNQIQQIIRLNANLKTQYQGQADQIQRITEQARIHQQILNKLETARTVPVNQGGDAGDDFVRQEKIRLIQEETEKNRSFLAQLEENTK